jgi:hypothetical protein
MPDLVTFLILTIATYRIGRFAILDDLIAGQRDRLYNALNEPEKLTAFRLKLTELMFCSACLTVWIAAAVTVFWSLAVQREWAGWSFLLTWPAVAGGSLIPWAYVDSEE